jgi:hypothetical protein
MFSAYVCCCVLSAVVCVIAHPIQLYVTSALHLIQFFFLRHSADDQISSKHSEQLNI